MLKPDQFIIGVDRALRVLSGQARSGRPYPAAHVLDTSMSEDEKRHAAGLMRVNHVGEICAQALYDAQSQFAHTDEVKQQLEHSGREEEDHLAWTAERVKELGSHTSLLNPFWYAGAFTCGVVAAKLGNATSLGFVVETERQVEAHLNGHLDKLPAQDARSRAIVRQMRDDEIAHGAAAAKLGARELPAPVGIVMKAMAKVMTSAAYYI